MKLSLFVLLGCIGWNCSFASTHPEETEARKELLSKTPRQFIFGKEHAPTYDESVAHFTRYAYSKFSLNQVAEALEAVELLARSGNPVWQVKYSKILLEGLDDFPSSEAEAKKYYLKAKPHESLLSGDVKSLFLELQAFFSSERREEKLTHSVRALSLK